MDVLGKSGSGVEARSRRLSSSSRYCIGQVLFRHVFGFAGHVSNYRAVNRPHEYAVGSFAGKEVHFSYG